MDNKFSFSANNNPQEQDIEVERSLLEWNSKISIEITNPHEINQGPIELKIDTEIFDKEIPRKEIQPPQLINY